MTQRWTAVAAAAFLFVVLSLSPVARAEDLRASPFRGALVPSATLAGDADATSLETNPGQLALIDGASLAFIYDQWSDNTPRAGRGTAFLLGTPLFAGLSLGLGLQSLRPTLADEPDQYWKLQAAFGLKLSRALGLGLSWEHLTGDRYGGKSSFTAGLGLRLHRTVSLGLALRDFGRPRMTPDEQKLPREWDGELAIRPLGTDRLELAGGARIEDGVEGLSSRPRPHARLSARVARGVTVFGEVDSGRDNRAVVLAETIDQTHVDWSALFGLMLAFGRLGLTGAGIVNGGVDGPERELGPGGSFVLRTFPGRRPPLIPERHIEQVALSGLENDGRFVEMLLRLRRLGDDPSVGAVLLQIDGLEIGQARIEELREVVKGLRQRKPVFAQVTGPSMREYYLAAACDRIVVHPAGMITVGGLSQTVTFYKGALDKLGVKVELVRIAEYKGAMEPFIMTEQSAPVRQNHNAVLDDDYSRLMGGIAEGRAGHVAAEKLPALVERAVFSAGEAQKQGLVDAVADEKDAETFVRASLGKRWAVGSGGGHFQQQTWVPARVGVVLVDGAIVDGADGGIPFSTGGLAYADRIIQAIEELRNDSSVHAVVLRVNSPGGSALASDRIARAVVRLRAAKPVVVSMGDLAASGGYYVAAPGDEIFASPSTTTGSIGIFSMKVDLEGLLGKIGLGGETYQRGPHADLYSPFRAWSSDERRIVETQIRSMYQLFLDTVAAGRQSRGVTAARADELGRGRIWTGAQALDVRLVDKLGGFSDALDEAARRGHVPLGTGGVPEVVILPRPVTSPLEALMRLQGMQAAETPTLVDRYGRALARLLAPLFATAQSALQARLPYEIEWR